MEFIIRETGLQLRRERLIAIATISTVAVLLVVLGAIVLFQLNLRLWTQRMAAELEVWGYFQRDLPRPEAIKLSQEIADWPEVRSVQFVPREEGLKRLKTYLPGSSALRGLGNPLPDAVRVKVVEARLVNHVAEKVGDLQQVRHVVPSPGSASREARLVDRVVQTKRIISWAGVAVAALVSLAGVFIVHNTVRLALHSRWREIYIMQLVGATRALIAAPFLLEGLVHGVVGAILAACLLIPGHLYLHSASQRSAPFITLLPDRDLLAFGLYLLLAGGLLGLTGSIVSIRRFLRGRPEWQA